MRVRHLLDMLLSAVVLLAVDVATVISMRIPTMLVHVPLLMLEPVTIAVPVMILSGLLGVHGLLLQGVLLLLLLRLPHGVHFMRSQ